MPDREKAITGLEKLRKDLGYGLPDRSNVVMRYLDSLTDAISLLKEQDVVEPFHKCIGKSFSLIQDSNYNYCPYCGKSITWEKQEGR